MRTLVPATIALIIASTLGDVPFALTQSATIKTDAMILTGEQTLSRATSMQRRLDSAERTASAALSSVRLKLSPRQAATLNSIGQELAARPGTASVIQKWRDFIISTKLTENDVNTLVQWVLQESYRQQQEDLRHYVNRLKRNRALIAKLSRERQSAQDYMITLGANRSIAAFRPDPSFGKHGALTSATQLRAYNVELDERLRRLTDDAQLADVDLQNVLQKQQQTLQMMSNISKMLHDMAMAVIRKVGG